jgi:Zn-dependent protease with chaperone function
MNAAVLLIVVAVSVVLFCFASNWLALIPWRNNRNAHWAEQARLLWPVRVAAESMLWALPVSLVLAWSFLDREATAPFLVLVGLVAAVATIAGTLPMDREVFPRIPLATLCRQASIGFCLRFLYWFVLIFAAAAMPVEFSPLSLVIFLAVVVFQLGWSRSGLMWFGRTTGLFAPAPDRLRRIVNAASARTTIAYREVWLMRSSSAQALALPISRELLFTERLLEILSDEELSAICAHELAHLAEPKRVLFLRTIKTFAYLPCIFIQPLSHALGPVGFHLPLAFAVLSPRLFLPISRRWESRADQTAVQQEENSGALARALLRLSEDNLAPVVTSRDQSMHPDLYDRVAAAGITPDFPRPKQPATMSWHGWLISFAVGLLLATYAIRQFR